MLSATSSGFAPLPMSLVPINSTMALGFSASTSAFRRYNTPRVVSPPMPRLATLQSGKGTGQRMPALRDGVAQKNHRALVLAGGPRPFRVALRPDPGQAGPGCRGAFPGQRPKDPSDTAKHPPRRWWCSGPDRCCSPVAVSRRKADRQSKKDSSAEILNVDSCEAQLYNGDPRRSSIFWNCPGEIFAGSPGGK